MKQMFEGWIVVETYRYKQNEKFRPIGYIRSDGIYSGYVYVYPTKKCADIARFRCWNKRTRVVKARVLTL